ncbi:MAG: DUF58 domain-containing protein [Candidatus Aenigmatarchaeota archaeon]|nr:MAG: DUF58 domain-containing protein [Candidatus Aenigmarchaeota archaeon]
MNKIIKRIVIGAVLILFAYLLSISGIQSLLMNIKFDIVFLDFIYVLFVFFLPEIVTWTGYGIIFSVLWLAIKYKIYPSHRLERNYLGIKKVSKTKYIFLFIAIIFFIFVLPYTMRQPVMLGTMISNADQLIGNVTRTAPPMENLLFLLLYFTAFTFFTAVRVFIISPLYVFSSIRLDAFLGALFLAPLFYHALMINLVDRHVRVRRSTTKRLCQEGEKVTVKTEISTPFPCPNMSLPSPPLRRGSEIKRRQHSDRGLGFNRIKNDDELTLKEGYYNFDIARVNIFTLPFLRTSLFKVCADNSDLSVIPPLHYKTRVYIRKPSVYKETGDLIRKQLGSSMDFAGIRDYAPGDPLSRVWWKGVAKSGEMSVKEFHSFSEDRWMLVLDFTNENLKKETTLNMLKFSRIFIELCTRKDISIGLSTFAPSFYYIGYDVNKKRLLSALTKVTIPLYEISTKGVELIMKDALGGDLERLKKKCREKNMTLTMVYSYSGLGKQKTLFSWKGQNIFKNSMEKFFTNMKKSGKIVVLSDGNPNNMEMYRRFKSLCENKRYRYLFLLTTDYRKETAERLNRLRINHIYVPEERLAEPGFVMGLVRMV